MDSFRCLTKNLTGRRIVLRVGRLAVHEKKYSAAIVAAHEIDKADLRLSRTNGSELFFESQVNMRIDIFVRSRKRSNALNVYSLSHLARLLKQVGTHFMVSIDSRQPGKQRTYGKNG